MTAYKEIVSSSFAEDDAQLKYFTENLADTIANKLDLPSKDSLLADSNKIGSMSSFVVSHYIHVDGIFNLNGDPDSQDDPRQLLTGEKPKYFITPESYKSKVRKLLSSKTKFELSSKATVPANDDYMYELLAFAEGHKNKKSNADISKEINTLIEAFDQAALFGWGGLHQAAARSAISIRVPNFIDYKKNLNLESITLTSKGTLKKADDSSDKDEGDSSTSKRSINILNSLILSGSIIVPVHTEFSISMLSKKKITPVHVARYVAASIYSSNKGYWPNKSGSNYDMDSLGAVVSFGPSKQTKKLAFSELDKKVASEMLRLDASPLEFNLTGVCNSLYNDNNVNIIVVES